MHPTFISVAEARDLIAQNILLKEAVSSDLLPASGRVLAEEIRAEQDHPHFRQSAMDGFAFRFSDWQKQHPLRLAGESAAGEEQDRTIGPGETIRIFTGAPLPTGADTVVMQEKTSRSGSLVTISDERLLAGSNVRPIGSEIAKGELALPAGTLLTPAAIGFLAALGKTSVQVFPSPQITLITSGNELQAPGAELGYGQVYESNSFALLAALRQAGCTEVDSRQVADDPAALKKAVEEGLRQSDLLLITGGVSVGDYDFTTQALRSCGVQTVFHKVRQKPGKPLYFGKGERTLVFGLPGNPSSVLTCFYEYVLHVLRRMMRLPGPSLISVQMCLENDVEKKAGLTQFLKAKATPDGVQLLGAQESYRMRSFATANALVVMEEERTVVRKGEQVEVHLLPG